MKIAFVLHPGRPDYESIWLSRMPIDKLVLIHAPGQVVAATPSPKVELREVDIIPSRNPFLHATASPVRYTTSLSAALADADIILTIEAFSTTTRQALHYASLLEKKSAVLVYEVLSSHPVYRLPPFKRNTAYTFARADQLICVTEQAKLHLEALGADPGKATVIYPGIDLEAFAYQRNAVPHSLVTVGKLEQHKGVDSVLATFDQIKDVLPGAHLTIVGSGSLEPEVKRAVALGSQIEWIPYLANSKLPGLLARHDVFMLPARYTKRFGLTIGAEQFGFSLVEAMATGLTVVSTDCGAIKEVVGRRNVVVPVADDHALFSATLEVLLENKAARSLRSISNRRMCEGRYDINKQAVRLADALEAS